MKKADRKLAAVILVLAVLVWLAARFFAPQDAVWVVVERDGIMLDRLLLDSDTSRRYTDSSGSENVLTVRDGRVFMESANCPDGLCVRQGSIAKSNETIICLPHKLAVTLEGSNGTASELPDAVTN